MDFSHIVSEDKIKRAIKDGDFQNLPGMGKPLPKMTRHTCRNRCAWAIVF